MRTRERLQQITHIRATASEREGGGSKIQIAHRLLSHRLSQDCLSSSSTRSIYHLSLTSPHRVIASNLRDF